MTNRKRVFWATTALFSGLLVAGAASAQSSGTVATEATELDTVVVTGVRGPFTTDGAIVAETVAKTRSTITQEFIADPEPGPDDPADPEPGSRRELHQHRPLRQLGRQHPHPRLRRQPHLADVRRHPAERHRQLRHLHQPAARPRADRAAPDVNLGTTDVDSPTASATGGTINYTTAPPASEVRRPRSSPRSASSTTAASSALSTPASSARGARRPALAGSYTEVRQVQGPGRAREDPVQRQALSADLGDNGDFVSLSASTTTRTATTSTATSSRLAQFDSGSDLDNRTSLHAARAGAGVARTTTTQARLRPFGRHDRHRQLHQLLRPAHQPVEHRQHPRPVQLRPDRTTSRFTFDPSFQYTLANGGGIRSPSERDNRFDQQRHEHRPAAAST